MNPAEEKEFRFRIGVADFAEYGNTVISELEKYATDKDGWRIADDNREGIRIYFDSDDKKGWLLLRLSVHDPIMPLNIESDVAGGVRKIASDFIAFLNRFDKLDITPILVF